MVIGLFDNAQYDRGHVKFQTGDVLALCTDGITEAMDTQNEEFGLERLVASVKRVTDLKAKDIVMKVCDEVTIYSRGGTHVDDKVMLAVKIVDGSGEITSSRK